MYFCAKSSISIAVAETKFNEASMEAQFWEKVDVPKD
jgi:hypothetical protein